HVRFLLERLGHEWGEVGRELAKGDRIHEVDAVGTHGVLDNFSAVGGELVVVGDHQDSSFRMCFGNVDLDVGGDGLFFAQAVTDDVLAGDGGREVAVGHDVDARRADGENRNLEGLCEWVHGDRRVREGRAEEREQV